MENKINLNEKLVIFGSKDKDFNESEIVDRFREWFTEMNNRRLTKKGKLFEFFVNYDYESGSFIFGNTQIFSGSGVGENPYEYIAMVQKVKYVIARCIELANQLASEYNVIIEEHNLPAVPTTVRYNVIRRK